MARFSYAFMLLMTAASTAVARADVVELIAGRDNSLYQEAGNVSNGQGAHLFSGLTFTQQSRRALLAFDIAGSVPAGATINSAELTLHLTRTPFTGTMPFALHVMTSDWGEAASDAGEPGGGGDVAEPGDATWSHAFYDTVSWGTSGGDFEPTASATAMVMDVLGPFTWASPDMAGDVQEWLDRPDMDFGWILLGDEAFDGSARRFASREHGDSSMWPALTVDYTPIPEPGTAALLAILGLGAAATAKRRMRQRDC